MRSIFKNEAAEKEYDQGYERSLALFDMDFSSFHVPTTFGETYVLRFGDTNKKPLLLFHGMTMSSTMWYPNMKAMTMERCVYAIDVIGDFGRSKPDAAIKNRRDAEQWIVEILNELKLDKVDMAGHSMGGFLSLNFALAHPDRVSKLLLYAPAGSFHKISCTFFLKIYPALLFHTEKWIDKAFRWFSGKGERLPPVFREQVISGYQNAKPQLRIMPSVFSEKEFKGFQVSTLLLVGDKEVIYPSKKVMTRAESWIQNVENHLIAGASHSLTLENAEIVNELTVQFLRKDEEVQFD